MNNQEQRKLSPPGRENNHICNKCGWAYPNPHPSAKHRRAHKKICGKPQGFKGIDSDDRTQSGFSDDEQQQNHSDDDRQTPLPKFEKGGHGSDVVGGRRLNKSEDELFADAVTEFSPVDSEKSVEIIEDSGPLLKVDANTDSTSSPGTEGSFMGLSDSGKVERAVEVDLDSSPLLKLEASTGLGSTDRLDVGVVKHDTDDTKKMDEHEVDEVLANVPEHLTRNLGESFETEIKSLDTDGNTSPSRDDGVSQSELEQGGGELKMSDLPLEVESIHQWEENAAQNVDISKNGDSNVSANTKTEGEAVHILSVAEDIPIVGDSDNLIEDFKDSHAVKSNVPLKPDSAEVISLRRDDDKDIVHVVSSTKMNAEVDSVSGVQIKDDFDLDTDIVDHGDLIEDSDDMKPLGDSHRVPVDMISSSTNQESEQITSLPTGDDTNEQEKLICELSDIHPNEITEVVVKDVEIDTSNSRNVIPTHPDSQKCQDLDAQEVVNEAKIVNEGEVVESIGSVAMVSESEDRVDAEVSEPPILNEQKSSDEDSQEVVKENKIVNDGEVAECISTVAKGSESNNTADSEVTERISVEPSLKESSPGHLPYASEQSILSRTAVDDAQHEDDEQVASAGTTSESMLEKGKDSLSKDHSSVDISADLSSQNSLEANWGSASVQSTPSDAQASVDAETLYLSPQEPTKSEQSNFGKSGHASEEDELNQTDALEPPSFISVVERGGVLDQNETEAAQNFDHPKPESLADASNESDERKKDEEAMTKVTNWSTAKHHSTPLKSLLGEADKQKSTVLQKDEVAAEKKDVLTTTVKSVLSDEAPAANQSANREVGKEWNSPAKYPGSKKDRKKVKGKPSWVPFVCCSSVNVN